jgi:multidrug efflux pump subunit AcrB
MTPRDPDIRPGPLAWMVHHRVAPNLIMLVLIIGGLIMADQIKKEVFPEFTLDFVTVTVPYPGASPSEVEQGVILAIEEAVRGLEGIKEVRSTASENAGTVSVELMTGEDRQKLYQDVQQAVERITTFPDDIEEPRIALSARRHDVLDIEVYGDVDPLALHHAAELVRDTLLQSPDVTQVELDTERELEIHIEVDQQTLRAHDLTLDQVAAIVANSALDRAGGSVETESGDILLRVKQRKYWAREFQQIPVLATGDGTVVRLGDIARVSEGFEDVDSYAFFNDQPAVGVDVFRVGDQSPISVVDGVRKQLPVVEAALPPSIHIATRNDNSETYRQRLELLLQNGFLGLLLVLLLLSLFLEFKLAFWVTVGIPTSFLGAFLFLPGLGVSLNMVSMFAFIVALGIVVDDAIVAGENIYEYRQRGMGAIQAAIEGARDVAVPITFSILTNVVAFLPLATVPGGFGKIWAVIPAVVATVFIISWIEALIILPAHLGHVREKKHNGESRFHAFQVRFTERFNHFVEHRYGPFVDRAVSLRYVSLAGGLALLIVVLAVPVSGHMGFILMPEVESDRASANITMPVGTPNERVREVVERVAAVAEQIVADNGGEQLSSGAMSDIDENEGEVDVYLTDPDTRPISTSEFSRRWREAVGQIPGVESLRYSSAGGGPGGGPSVSVELSHSDIGMLDKASTALANQLSEFSTVKDVDDGFTPGKQQLDFRLREEARAAGLTAADVARQVRFAFYGAEALKQQRGRNEITVRVWLPENERDGMGDIENLLLSLPNGGYVPLYQVATVERGHAFTTITRRDARRTVTVTGNVEPISATTSVLTELRTDILPQLVRDYPGLSWSFEGRQASMRDAVNSFYTTATFALIGIFVLLAIPFRSYIQPLIVMMAIPFGLVGAILGHMIMGYSLSLVSLMGIIALSGVVVNGSLVMIDYANRLRDKGDNAHDAIIQAAIRRFRPILLTTLTTFGGLAPMIFETSRQARFMIPMAISLGYGILFSTAIILVLIPCLYMMIEDIREAFIRMGRKAKEVVVDSGE